jgi:hypothetical protein
LRRSHALDKNAFYLTKSSGESFTFTFTALPVSAVRAISMHDQRVREPKARTERTATPNYRTWAGFDPYSENIGCAIRVARRPSKSFQGNMEKFYLKMS